MKKQMINLIIVTMAWSATAMGSDVVTTAKVVYIDEWDTDIQKYK